ncbi:FecR family protein [Flexithrix dorotheae]|uniref:FecR family protein n=1 Tax=Flexithrix dorotheae TaxID=70993 RepID=UPI0003729E74|nr:FecR family protein [Flexithrix dorotheae]
MNYSNFNIEDFLADEGFQNFILHPKDKHDHLWTNFLKEYPEKRAEFMEAAKLLKHLEIEPRKPIPEEFEMDIQEISAYLNQPNITTKRNNVVQLFPYWRKIAAAFLFMAFSATLYFYVLPKVLEKPVAEAPSIETIERETPKGTKLILTLKDGTRVKLNAESKLSFPESFSDEFREVTLVGEAFFEVAKDSTKPFVIKSGNLTTTVLGTAFNIKAYPGEEDIKVAVEEGKVKVETAKKQTNMLVANEMVTFNKMAGGIQKSHFNPAEILCWKENTICFKDASFDEIKTTLERWYGVDFIMKEGLEIKEEFNGTFVNKSLEEVLIGLNYTSNFKYDINGKSVFIR